MDPVAIDKACLDLLYQSHDPKKQEDIDVLEKTASNESNNQDQSNGRYVSFTNSVVGFERLYKDEVGDPPPFNHRVDLFFGARPSKEQLKDAKDHGVELIVTPIGKEAFVFFVNENNPVDNLTLDQIRDIYSGKIHSWSEVGGPDKLITPLSRIKGSGSRTAMETVMNGEPIAHDLDAAFGKRIAYSFRFYAEGITNYGGIKILSINGVYPSVESIKDGSYPIASEFYAVYRADNTNPNIPIVIDWLLSDEGQELVEANGYVRVG